MALRCVQRNIRALRGVAKWSWWRLFCRVRPLLDVNMDDERLRAKEVHTRSHTHKHTHTHAYLHTNTLTRMCTDVVPLASVNDIRLGIRGR